MNELVERLTAVVPSKRQLKWHELQFYGFIHFGMNTFTEREWGEGKESPKLFNPTDLDTDQWIRCLKDAGMKGAILTCKHHDGFCLWPSEYTDYTIAHSPYKGGNGDIVAEMAQSCKKYGLKFGVYLSPWDRHDKRYGDSDAYNDYFINQLTELLTQYGEIFSVWFDGACGEGENGKRQVYDWERYYDTIRKLQPDACISVCGPDVRWCGNEAGDCRPSEWNVVPARLSQAEIVKEKSQQSDDHSFREKKISSSERDLGSREALADEKTLIWYPAEVDVSIRPGWFYHKEEDGQVKSLEQLLKIYYQSVGGNAGLLLNIPPDKRGRIHEVDERRLYELGAYLRRTFAYDCVPQAKVYIQDEKKQDDGLYKIEESEEQMTITFVWENPHTINHVVLKEALTFSQRIETFEVQIKEEDRFTTIYEGTVVGSCKICAFNVVTTSCMRIVIKQSRKAPRIQFIGIYESK